VIWRDTTRLAEHRRAPDGAHQRVVEPAHYSLLFAKKPRAQVMLYREALLQLGQTAKWYVSELSHRQRAHLREEVVGVYTLSQQIGAERLLALMEYATERSAYSVDYLLALKELSERPTWPALFPPLPAAARLPVAAAGSATAPAALVGIPPQDEVDRALGVYEHYVPVDGTDEPDEAEREGAPALATAAQDTVVPTVPTVAVVPPVAVVLGVAGAR
jgi:hypothetical protein